LHGTGGTTTTLTNFAGATIRGSTDSIFSDTGRLSVTNHGTITGNISLNSVDAGDQIINTGTINGDASFAHGTNLFDGRGGTITGDGVDTLIGGKGADELFGGLAANTFKFMVKAEIGKGAAGDTIEDLSAVGLDVIDLTALDASTKAKGNQTFHYIGSQHFHHKAGELNFTNHVLSADTNGDGKADFQINVLNVDTLTKGIDIHL